MNGLSLHGGIIPYGGTFLMFSEYARNALRMAALMKIRNIFVFTHDSIGLGEDGPTHQPVEQTATLRMIPNMDVWRPCDTVESIVSWVSAIERREGPSSLIFSRQNLPFQKRDAVTISLIRKGDISSLKQQTESHRPLSLQPARKSGWQWLHRKHWQKAVLQFASYPCLVQIFLTDRIRRTGTVFCPRELHV